MSPASPWLRTRSFIARLCRPRRESPQESQRLQALREHCHGMIRDLGPGQQLALALRIAHAQDADDFWHLRACLFGAVALEHGEREADARLLDLDRLTR